MTVIEVTPMNDAVHLVIGWLTIVAGVTWVIHLIAGLFRVLRSPRRSGREPMSAPGTLAVPAVIIDPGQAAKAHVAMTAVTEKIQRFPHEKPLGPIAWP